MEKSRGKVVLPEGHSKIRRRASLLKLRTEDDSCMMERKSRTVDGFSEKLETSVGLDIGFFLCGLLVSIAL